MAAQVARRIAAETGDGEELMKWAFAVWRDPTETFENRRWAFEWLSDRGMGKPQSTVDITSHSTSISVSAHVDLSSATDEELAELENIQRRVLQRNVQKVIDVPTSDP